MTLVLLGPRQSAPYSALEREGGREDDIARHEHVDSQQDMDDTPPIISVVTCLVSISTGLVLFLSDGVYKIDLDKNIHP